MSRQNPVPGKFLLDADYTKCTCCPKRHRQIDGLLKDPRTGSGSSSYTGSQGQDSQPYTGTQGADTGLFNPASIKKEPFEPRTDNHLNHPSDPEPPGSYNAADGQNAVSRSFNATYGGQDHETELNAPDDLKKGLGIESTSIGSGRSGNKQDLNENKGACHVCNKCPLSDGKNTCNCDSCINENQPLLDPEGSWPTLPIIGLRNRPFNSLTLTEKQKYLYEDHSYRYYGVDENSPTQKLITTGKKKTPVKTISSKIPKKDTILINKSKTSGSVSGKSSKPKAISEKDSSDKPPSVQFSSTSRSIQHQKSSTDKSRTISSPRSQTASPGKIKTSRYPVSQNISSKKTKSYRTSLTRKASCRKCRSSKSPVVKKPSSSSTSTRSSHSSGKSSKMRTSRSHDRQKSSTSKSKMSPKQAGYSSRSPVRSKISAGKVRSPRSPVGKRAREKKRTSPTLVKKTSSKTFRMSRYPPPHKCAYGTGTPPELSSIGKSGNKFHSDKKSDGIVHPRHQNSSAINSTPESPKSPQQITSSSSSTEKPPKSKKSSPFQKFSNRVKGAFTKKSPCKCKNL